MKMIPARPYNTSSQAEKTIFDKLGAAYANEKNIVAFHSLNLTHHQFKRFGEIDFLILCPQGLYVIEIKGGRVSCKQGIWTFTNRYNDSNTKRESPFRQAETALHGLMARMASEFDESLMAEITMGYGVVLTDCTLPVAGAEWHKAVLCDGGAHRDLAGWLQGLIKYWQQKDHKKRCLSADNIEKITAFLRPNFDTVLPLHLYLNEAEQAVYQLTESQLLLVDAMENNPRVCCEGAAGTGKTFLALELARRWCARGLTVALVCYSPWLKNYLEQHHGVNNLVLATPKGLKQALCRAGIEAFDAIIIDEGQDILRDAPLSLLNQALVGGLANGRWCFFMDVNNQSGFFDEALCHKTSQKAIDYLYSLQPVLIPLRNNCRNTHLILNKIKTDIGADMGVSGAGFGAEVREHWVLAQRVIQAIASEVQELVSNGGLLYQQITILSDSAFIDTLFADDLSIDELQQSLKDGVGASLCRLDEYAVKYFPPDAISLATVANFKGLENDAIIFMSPTKSLLANKALSYVAMSRARSVLSIIYVIEPQGLE